MAYKTYNVKSDEKTSYYTVRYDGRIYIYIDFREACEKDFAIDNLVISDAQITELEKSANISYEIKDGKICAVMEDGAYGYLVLCVNEL